MTEMKKAKACADILQAIAEPNRIRIIDCLQSGPKNVTEIASMLKLEIVNVSHHLGVLRQSKLVTDEKQGRFVIYSMNPDMMTQERGAMLIDLNWCRVEIPQK